MVIFPGQVNFLTWQLAQYIEQLFGIEGHLSFSDHIGRVISFSSYFQIGRLNTYPFFFGGEEQVRENGHRALGLYNSLNLLYSIEESVLIDPDFHLAGLQNKRWAT